MDRSLLRGAHFSAGFPIPQSTVLRVRTLLVEDSPVIRENLAATLEELGPVSIVGAVEDQQGALEWLENTPGCELMIVDLFLKRGSGLGVLEEVGKLRMQPRMVVLSNYATPDMRRRCLSAGADRVFDKSTEIDALLDYCTLLASNGTTG